MDELVLLCVLALLICNTAAGLASRLAGSLALAASALFCALAKVTGLDSLDMLHNSTSKKSSYKFYHFIPPMSTEKVHFPFILRKQRRFL